MPIAQAADHLRAGLVDALAAVGPDAPTLCQGWRSRHLAAHLVLREHESLRMAGLLIPALAGRVERRTRRVGGAADHDGHYQELLARFAAGPGQWSPWRLFDEQANVLEYAVHREDVVRATKLPPTTLSPDLTEAIWTQFRARARLLFRSAPCRLILILDPIDGGGRVALRGSRACEETAIIRGRLLDVLLYGFGRTAVTVQVDGPAAAVEALAQWSRAA